MRVVNDPGRLARPLRSPADLEPLVEAARGKRFVAIGEA